MLELAMEQQEALVTQGDRVVRLTRLPGVEVSMDRSDAEHLVRRTGFGVDWALVDQLAGLSRTAAVDELLDFSKNPAGAVPSSVMSESGVGWEQVRDLTKWWLERMRTVPRPLQELLALFWHGHFATNALRVEFPHQLADQLQLFRTQGTGSFRDLVQNVSIGPAMLLYLDNYKNEASSPNENFARELLELHTLSPGNYTERDIIETARAWTGHSLDNKRTYSFDAGDHDNGSKTIFGVTKNFDGPEVVDEIVMGVRRDACARFIASKLWSFFAYPNPPGHIVDELVVPYIASGMNVSVLLKAVLTHDAFYGTTSRQGLVRGPVHWTISCAAGGRIPVAECHPEQFLGEMGQSPFYPETPEGWGFNDVWISPVAMWSRADFARNVANRMSTRTHLKHMTDQPVPTAVETLRVGMGVLSLSAATRRAIEDYLYAERAAGHRDEFKNAATLMMLSPEMQMA